MSEEPKLSVLTPMRALAEQTERFGGHWRARRINRSYFLGALVVLSPAVLLLVPAPKTSPPRPLGTAAIHEQAPGPGTVMHVVVVPARREP